MTNQAKSETVGKALSLLSILGGNGVDRLSLGDIAAQAGLSKPTTHRLLGTLVDYSFVERVPGSRLYRLGPAVAALARHDTPVNRNAQRWRRQLMQIATATKAAAFVLIRSGDDALCMDAYFGEFMMPTLTAGIGGRVPLGLGPGSLAILAALDDDEVRDILGRNASRLHLARPDGLDDLLNRVRRTRERGVAFDPGELLPEVRGLAITLSQYGTPLAMTLSIASLASRLSEEQIDSMAALLRDAARHVVDSD